MNAVKNTIGLGIMSKVAVSEKSRVFLHGTPLMPSVWDEVAARLGGANIIPDLTPGIAADHDNTSVQKSVAASVLSQVPSGPLSIVGHSFGGQVAVELALLVPDRVRTITVLCSRLSPFPPFISAAAELASGGEPDVEGTMRRWFTDHELQANGTVVDYARARLKSADRQVWATALRAIGVFDRVRDVGLLKTPFLLLCAGRDTVSTPVVMGEFASAVSNSTLTIDRSWAHMSPFVDPRGLACTIDSHERRFNG